jgi:hypothetical protein
MGECFVEASETSVLSMHRNSSVFVSAFPVTCAQKVADKGKSAALPESVTDTFTELPVSTGFGYVPIWKVVPLEKSEIPHWISASVAPMLVSDTINV